jgi:hypothetical protein
MGTRGLTGLTGGHLARFTPRRVVAAQKCLGTLDGGLRVVAVRDAAAPAPQAHLIAPYRPRYSLDQRTAGQYLRGLGTPGDGHIPCLLRDSEGHCTAAQSHVSPLGNRHLALTIHTPHCQWG